MIYDQKLLCKELSEESGLDLDLLLSINNIVFKEVFDWTKNPTALRVYIKHFGNFFFKKQKTLIKLNFWNRVLNSDRKLEDKEKEMILTKVKNYSFIISEYEKYTKERYELKCNKYGKENYESFCLAKRQEKVQKAQENKSL